jgi:putative nucleotidyltransferase with HDIG domain
VALIPQDDERHLAKTLERDSQTLSSRERLAEWWIGGGFVVAAALVLALGETGDLHPLPAALALAVFAVASRIRFDSVYGFTVPTQLAFVPLIFAMPVNWLPVAVAAGLMLARIPDVVAGEMRPSRMVHVLGNSWFAIGPALVLSIAGTDSANASAAVLVAALAAQFVGDFCASAARDMIGSGATVREQFGEVWVYGVDLALTPVALAVGVAIEITPLAALAPLPLIALLGFFARERRQRLEGLLELSNAYSGTALLLGDVVEADDAYTGRHSRSVVDLCLAVGDELAIPPDRRRNLEFGALLHDVGKIAIPKEIINKPGKLDPDEWQVIKTHTIEGQKMLERVGGFMQDVGLIVRSHHERWDGGGYPDGLAGEDVPLEARIISCCDAWNAMRTDRPYRPALAHEAARAEMVRGSGTQFDPEVVEALLRVVEPEGDQGLDIRPDASNDLKGASTASIASPND